MGINRGDVFPSKYISSADVDGREISLVVQDVQMEDLADGEQKAVLYFTKGKKGMILNVTNWNVLEEEYGTDTDSWIGQPVVLCVERTTFKGKPTKGLRLHIPAAAAPINRAPAPPPKPAPQEHSEVDPPFEDDIPF